MFIIILLILDKFKVFLFSINQKEHDSKKIKLKKALFYEKLDEKKVRCNLCPRRCVLGDGGIGFCRVRQNIDGVLYSLNYGKIAAINVDPIEKKPFFHFLPGTKSFSVACAGCNLRCKFCQNWQISQRNSTDDDVFIEPEKLVELAIKSGSKSIAYTYSEPVVFFEYLIDTAKIAKKNGLKNVVVTAGFINPEPLKYMLKHVDAVKVDFKGFNPGFYLKYTQGRVEPILETMKIIKQSKKHLEIVNLVIPGGNDKIEDIKKLCSWIKENLGSDVPLHFTRFHPDYQMTQTPPTPLQTLIEARKIAIDMGIKYVYVGNISYPEGENTYCPDGSIAIERRGFLVLKNNLKNGKCPEGSFISGVWR
ncbi:MAG: AmmeMemoRadiSam system radical SAM enzyme [Elusimicrobiales bacterium]|nr:AmmeMemoRadiSam system radical SAM enzyme [Elusimicrobiales bacterium]